MGTNVDQGQHIFKDICLVSSSKGRWVEAQSPNKGCGPYFCRPMSSGKSDLGFKVLKGTYPDTPIPSHWVPLLPQDVLPLAEDKWVLKFCCPSDQVLSLSSALSAPQLQEMSVSLNTAKTRQPSQ